MGGRGLTAFRRVIKALPEYVPQWWFFTVILWFCRLSAFFRGGFFKCSQLLCYGKIRIMYPHIADDPVFMHHKIHFIVGLRFVTAKGEERHAHIPCRTLQQSGINRCVGWCLYRGMSQGAGNHRVDLNRTFIIAAVKYNSMKNFLLFFSLIPFYCTFLSSLILQLIYCY